MQINGSDKCPACKNNFQSADRIGQADAYRISCRRCGEYEISSTVLVTLGEENSYLLPYLSAKVEVTMPLTPRYAVFLSHDEKISGYRQLSERVVQEFNRRTRFHCDQWFVSWQGEVREEWFDAGTPPEDRWENSPEGKRAAEQRERHDELRRRYEEHSASHDEAETRG
jgi:hypothetical protein